MSSQKSVGSGAAIIALIQDEAGSSAMVCGWAAFAHRPSLNQGSTSSWGRASKNGASRLFDTEKAIARPFCQL